MSDSYPESLSALQALRMLGDERRALLVDIRSSDEFLSGGHPAGAVNIPWFDEPDWQINPNFVAELRQLRRARAQSADDGDDVNGIPLILICRSGRRSLLAGQALLSAGLRSIYHVQDGFEGEADAACQHGSGGSGCFHGLPQESA
ncbi:rhodanese-like domain-containing protein [Rhodocyclus tenuis]|uniref:Rhodanese-related sulfurtransferase n=1 Tax=Rhodocyclus tenuis TaxID=1066 RepID=A0A840FXB6_RHOTE|nr:rhodanese-like domain-containing protein [Rhodocyclus tenuis]MBB4246434.1 rhodanese-related sulfurtransferase [Rhodocyclus tenuis]